MARRKTLKPFAPIISKNSASGDEGDGLEREGLERLEREGLKEFVLDFIILYNNRGKRERKCRNIKKILST
jgi:hypothetical protein